MRMQQVQDAQRRLDQAMRASQARGDQRHHEIDERFAAVEKNTARIVALEAAIQELQASVDALLAKVNIPKPKVP